MTPSAPHAPPRPKEASARIWGEPPDRSTVFNLPSAKNAMERPSKDQKGKMESSVPGELAGIEGVDGAHPDSGLAIDAGSGERDPGTIERKDGRSSGIACEVDMRLLGRVDGGANRWPRSRVVQKESGDDAEEDGEEGCAPAQARPLLQRLGRDRGSCDC